MKRLVTFVIFLVLVGYAFVLLANINFLGIRKTPYLGSKMRQLGSFCGLGTLFTRETSMISHATVYRFYQNGKWERWQELEKPLFQDYVATGRLASLKHNRLDKRLMSNLNRVATSQGLTKMKQTKAFDNFTAHLFFNHNQKRIPDSLELKYFQIYNSGNSTKTLTAFKFKP